jgi:hypothetical protein
MTHYSMQTDMMEAEWFLNKVKPSKSYAQNLYAAMCNNDFQKQDTWEVLTDNRWSCSWRAAAGVVATLRDCNEDYMDYYCSGMGGFADYNTDPETYYAETGYVQESVVTDEIREDLLRLGWVVIVAE